MQKNQSLRKRFLHKLLKCVIYLIVAVVMYFIALLSFYFYDKSKFINECLTEGSSQEYCQSIWAEVDALN